MARKGINEQIFFKSHTSGRTRENHDQIAAFALAGMTILTDQLPHVAEEQDCSFCESTALYRDTPIYVSDWTSSW